MAPDAAQRVAWPRVPAHTHPARAGRSRPLSTRVSSRRHPKKEVVRENRRPVSRVLSVHTRKRAYTGWSFLSAFSHPNAPAAYPRLDRTHCTRSRAPHTRPLARRAVSRRIFGLAPAGVYRAADVAADAVGSYPTVSPLPRLPPFSARHGGLFSVALSVIRRSRRECPGVTWQHALWSPDFPRKDPMIALQRTPLSSRPSGRRFPVLQYTAIGCASVLRTASC